MKTPTYILIFITVLGLVFSCQQAPENEFVHRGYSGWLMDLSRTARIGHPWPSIVIDSALMADYEETLEFLQRSEITEITIWGLFTNSSWEPEINKTIDGERKAIILDILAMAHKRGIKVICGLGVYSWGFDKIMEANPALKCSCNDETMDLSNPQALLWQQRVIDYIMDAYPFDGLSMQSADRGRCACGEYGDLSAMEYHAFLNQQVVDYIRSKNEDYIIGISGWGMNFSDPADLESIVQMTRNIDYLIDPAETVLKHGREYRQEFIQAITPCAYGNIGTPNVEPIHAMLRSHYFVPTAGRAVQNLKELFDDGGRACDTYYRSLGNPGDEITVEVLAQILSDPNMDYEDAMKNTLSLIYNPVDDAAMRELMKIISEAEDAYFDHAVGDKQIILLLSRGEIEPSSEYLERMSLTALQSYKTVMEDLYGRVVKLSNKITNQERYMRLLDCLENVLDEIRRIENEASMDS